MPTKKKSLAELTEAVDALRSQNGLHTLSVNALIGRVNRLERERNEAKQAEARTEYVGSQTIQVREKQTPILDRFAKSGFNTLVLTRAEYDGLFKEIQDYPGLSIGSVYPAGPLKLMVELNVTVAAYLKYAPKGQETIVIHYPTPPFVYPELNKILQGGLITSYNAMWYTVPILESIDITWLRREVEQVNAVIPGALFNHISKALYIKKSTADQALREMGRRQ